MSWDAVAIGSGPNGLAAAITLARAGRSVLVLEAEAAIGGGTRSAELTLPGFVHDVCSAVHPLGLASPFFRSLPLQDYGLEWILPPSQAAHPFDDGSAAVLELSVGATGETLGRDGDRYGWLLRPLVDRWQPLLEDLLAPPRIPRHPLPMLRFGAAAAWPARLLSQVLFRSARARGFFAGMAAHSVAPLEMPLTSAFSLMLGLLGHAVGWPVARGGSQSIAEALAAYLRTLGGEIRTGERVASLDRLPPARAILMDLSPRQVLALAAGQLPAGYRRRLERFRYGPAAFKLDWALAGPIPWRAPACARASTVHLGGTLDEICASEREAWRGTARASRRARPFVLLAQQSLFDGSRAPAGQHTGWAYCHVPHGSPEDWTDAIEAQVERFAPGFRDLILARHATAPAEFERHNANYVGGDVVGGANHFTQLFTRPVVSLDPYATPNPRLFICSASTSPGGGVHGMCGFHAARSALRGVLR